jgi:phage tail sheath protein FI
MPTYVSPGVYTREIDLSLYIPALSTTIVGMVGVTDKGPVNTPTYISNQQQFVNTFGPPDPSYLAGYSALQYLRRGRQLWFVRVVGPSALAATVDLEDSGAGTAVTVDALNVGDWGNSITVTVATGSNGSDKKMTVFFDGDDVEVWDNMKITPATDPQYWETIINGNSQYVEVTVGVTGLQPENIADEPLAGGTTDAGNVADTHIIGVSSPARTGLQLFEAATDSDINILAAPEWSGDEDVAAEIITICETRADCLGIIDVPYGSTPATAVDYINGTGTYSHTAFDSSYAAVYYPWIKIYDAANAQDVWTPPTGHVLGVFAYNDRQGESWYAPAGYRRGKVIAGTELEYLISDGDNDLLYGDGNMVNAIRSFPRQGMVVWGQRTAQRAPTALDRINVRRLLLYIRKVLSTASQYIVFEPNDEKTWNEFAHLTIPFMSDLVERRGLYDFRVVCDETTNTPEVIDRNEMHAKIFLKPVKAAEFIQVDLVITRTGATFDEVLY